MDGSSWVWKFAIITKENLIGMLLSEIDDMESSINKNKQLIEDLRNGCE